MSVELNLFLSKEIEENLPGKSAHIKMLPTGRILDENPVNKRNAAVTILICPNTEGEEELMFIKRTEYEGHHSGQVSFPGGKADKEDIDLLATAIRECHEEIGVILTKKNLLGSLTPVYVMVSEFMIYPFLFFYPSIPEIKIDPDEVNYIFQFPVNKLLDYNIRKKKIMHIMGQDVDVPYFHIMGETIWGATAMILSEFIEILNNIKIKNPGILKSRD
jgi:8-oxo-dGTP pyrophosphatase MutT (NUDIX family)